MEKFKVTNVTVKPLKKDQHGVDLRTTVEKVGHPVSFRDNERPIILVAGRHCIVEKVDGGLLGLMRGGFVHIEKIKDISVALRDHAFDGEQQRQNRAAPTPKPAKKAVAQQMGLETHKQESGSEYEGARNPDGDPNFLVKATGGGGNRRKKREQNDAASGSGSDSKEQ